MTDEDVGVAIVPLTEENETAMDDSMFLDFMGKIGMAPPANEQVSLNLKCLHITIMSQKHLFFCIFLLKWKWQMKHILNSIYKQDKVKC